MWFTLLVILGVLLIVFMKRYMDGFKKWNHLPGVKPHWFWGNRHIISKTMKDIYLDHYHALDGHRFGTFWMGNEPTIFLKDLDLIKKVEVTDHEHFFDYGFLPHDDNAKNQFGLADSKGETWKRMKKALTPSFSGPRLKKNVATMNDSAIKLIGYLQSQENNEYVEGLVFTKKFYLSCIANVGFGFNVDCFSDKPSSFEEHAGQVFDMKSTVINEFFPNIGKLFNLTIINKKFSKYMNKVLGDIVKQRKQQNLQYNDMFNNLIEVSKVNPDMTEEVMYKTAVQFFSDGYDSAALVVCVVLYYLAVNPDVQSKLQEEIDEVFESKDTGEEIVADDITNMRYLDQVLLEGQRLGCLPFTARECTKDWQVPGDSFVIPKNTRVIIPIIGLHYDPKYWPNPMKFDPDRFSNENKSNIDSITFQPFGSGPRQCLGYNLANVESKVLLCHLFRNFNLKPYGDMPQDLVWSQNSFIGSDKYNFKLERREH